jgi:ABC-type transport system involved in multi-copper enzyme maturation permease subunit
MLKVIIEKEIRGLIGSTKFVFTFGASALLIIIAFYVGGQRHNLYQSHLEVRSMEGMVDWADLEETRIFLPPQPLASLVSGVSNDIRRTALVRGRGEIATQDSRYNEDPIFAIFRFIDLEFIFKVVLSLFAILLGYDAISGEKERGTLRLSFANAVPRQTYIAGKLIGSSLALTVSILTAIAVGTLVLPLLGISLSGQEWVRLLLIVGTGLLYFGAFLTLSVFVSALTHRSSNSFLVLLVVWVMCIHIVPRVSVLLAGRSVEVPTADEIAYQKSQLGTQLRQEFRDGMTKMPMSGAMMEIEKINAYIDSLDDIRNTKLQSYSSRLAEERVNRQKVQEALAFAIARVSPTTSLSLATSHLAGTSLGLKSHFHDEAGDYQGQYGNFMKEKTGMNTGGFVKVRVSTDCGGGGDDGEEEKPEHIDPQELPQFEYHNPTLAQSVDAALVDIGTLFFFNLLFFAGAFAAFTRYDVR